MAGHKKIRAEFRKNRAPRVRRSDWTREVHDPEADTAAPAEERVSGKGELSRRRTVRASEAASNDPLGLGLQLAVDEAACLAGRVLSIHGVISRVHGGDGLVYRCATRRILKTLDTGQRNVVAVGDRVLLRRVPNTDPPEGFIERIEPRANCVSRDVRGKQQILVANVDQLLIVASAAEPPLKPNLIDRLLVTAEKGRVRPLICINKIDLVDAASVQPLCGLYSQMGYDVFLLSGQTGYGMRRLARALAGKSSVVAGQSGVGKSTLLNAVDPSLQLRVREVSEETQKGKHTTTTARLLPLAAGGYVVDTPGVRQLKLWDVSAAEVAGFFRDLRPYVSLCRFPDCTHTHEEPCAVKDAVADGRVDERRYDSYWRILQDDEELK